MATKTLTITENAYDILKSKKIEGESFSQEIQRLLGTKTKMNLKDVFGIIPHDVGGQIILNIKEARKRNAGLESKRFEELWK